MTQFGKLFVLTGDLPPELGRNLNLSLELRAKARYKPRTNLSQTDAEVAVNLAEELLNIGRRRLAGEERYRCRKFEEKHMGGRGFLKRFREANCLTEFSSQIIGVSP